MVSTVPKQVAVDELVIANGSAGVTNTVSGMVSLKQVPNDDVTKYTVVSEVTSTPKFAPVPTGVVLGFNQVNVLPVPVATNVTESFPQRVMLGAVAITGLLTVTVTGEENTQVSLLVEVMAPFMNTAR